MKRIRIFNKWQSYFAMGRTQLIYFKQQLSLSLSPSLLILQLYWVPTSCGSLSQTKGTKNKPYGAEKDFIS